MVATAYETGRFFGTVLVVLVIPALLTWWAVRLKQRSSGVWWIPLALAIFFSLSGLLGPTIREAGDLRQRASLPRVDPETAFAAVGPYRFQPFSEEVRASIDQALQRNPAREHIEDFAVREILAEDGSSLGFVEVFAIEPAALDEADFSEGVARGAAEEGGGDPRRLRIGRRETLQFKTTEGEAAGYQWVVWLRPRTNLMIIVVALELEDARGVAKAMIDQEN